MAVEIGPRTVEVPASVADDVVNVYTGLFDPRDPGKRAMVTGCDRQRRVLLGRLHLEPAIRFESGARELQPDRGAHARSDRGWAEGMHPLDVFLKNTQEVLGPLHEATAHQVLERLEFLTPDRALRRARYGEGEAATVAVVNFGSGDAEVTSKLGGRVLLPPWGFVVEGPGFAAFYAGRWGGQDYARGALFTLRSLDGKSLSAAGRVRIFHGFGDPAIRWRGKSLSVRREEIAEF
jgi:hypothetical protein